MDKRQAQVEKVVIGITLPPLVPITGLDLLSTESADGFYEDTDFRRFEGFRKSYR